MTAMPPGGIPAITQMDVAAMLAHASAREEALLRAKYCGEPDHAAWAHLFIYLMEQGWEAEQGQIDTLTRIVLDDYLASGICSGCNGAQGAVIDNRWEVCTACGGIGRKALSDREIGRRLGYARLQEPWRTRVAFCKHKLIYWEIDCLARSK